MFKFDSIPQIFFKIFKPGLEILLMIFKPWLTKALFRPISGTTSQTVPSETRSRKSIRSGSLI